MEKGHSMKMGMFIEEILRMIYLMGDLNMKVQMEKFIKDNGDKEKNMDMATIIGQMEVLSKVNILMTWDMEKELWTIQMVKYMKANGMKVKKMEKVLSDLLKITSQEFGKTETWQQS